MGDQKLRAGADSFLMSRFSHAALLASLVMLLFACPSPISTDQINPVPTDLVLSVTGTVPPNGATGFDPGQTIVGSFNRDLDPACLQQSTSPVSVAQTSGAPGPSITLAISYDSPSKKLFIEPHPFLASGATYTVSFETTLKDASGNALPKQVDLSFSTGADPAGDFELNGGAAYVTTNDPVNLTVQHNPSAAYMCIANSVAALSYAAYISVGSLPATWGLNPGEGTQILYAQFCNADQTLKSAVRSVSIMRDTHGPTIQSATVPEYYNFPNISHPVRPVVSASDATSGIATYTWTGDLGVSFDTSTPPYTPQSPGLTISVGPSTEGKHDLWLTVTDHAGNHSDQAFTIWKDTVPPDKPTRVPYPDPTTYPQSLSYPYPMKWYWDASTTPSHPESEPADGFLVLLNGKPPESGTLHLSPLYYGTVTADHFDTYDLTVRQVDAAGNQSEALSIPILVTPVLPAHNSTTPNQYPGLQWHNFSGTTHTYYRVHLWSTSNPNHDLGGGVLSVDMRQTDPFTTLVTGQTYNWYVQWNFDGSDTFDTANRSPSLLDGNYTFTAGP